MIKTKKLRRKREPEPNTFRIANPGRITLAQSMLCEFDMSQRYRPVVATTKPFGVIMVSDSTPKEADDALGAIKAPSLEPEGECAPPEPFEWTPPLSDTTKNSSPDSTSSDGDNQKKESGDAEGGNTDENKESGNRNDSKSE